MPIYGLHYEFQYLDRRQSPFGRGRRWFLSRSHGEHHPLAEVHLGSELTGSSSTSLSGIDEARLRIVAVSCFAQPVRLVLSVVF